MSDATQTIFPINLIQNNFQPLKIPTELNFDTHSTAYITHNVTKIATNSSKMKSKLTLWHHNSHIVNSCSVLSFKANFDSYCINQEQEVYHKYKCGITGP